VAVEGNPRFQKLDAFHRSIMRKILHGALIWVKAGPP